MATSKANNHKDTYLATAYTLMLIGMLYLLDKLLNFDAIGLPWLKATDNQILYAAIIFLIFKRDKTVGCIMAGLWLVLNLGMVMGFIGSLSGYLLPIALLLAGAILYFMARK